MSRRALSLGLIIASACALFGACRSSTSSTERVSTPPDPIARFEGRWFRRGPENIIGARSDRIWTIAREGDGWTLAITVVRKPSVNQKFHVVTRTEFAPTPLEWRDGRLDFVYAQHPQDLRTRLTVDMMGDRLMLPAVVQRDERTWEFEGWNDRDSFQCEHDPRVVSTGNAVLWRPGYPNRPSYYRVAEASSGEKQGATVPCIQFFQIAPSGEEHMCFQLIFEGEPFGTSVRLGTTYSGYWGESWVRMSYEDWLAIQALPLVQQPLVRGV